MVEGGQDVAGAGSARPGCSRLGVLVVLLVFGTAIALAAASIWSNPSPWAPSTGCPCWRPWSTTSSCGHRHLLPAGRAQRVSAPGCCARTAPAALAGPRDRHAPAREGPERLPTARRRPGHDVARARGPGAGPARDGEAASATNQRARRNCGHPLPR
ncbi:hypothetical protein QJS66_10870 [Kocuria rhizophila]|nr:hypothetical protein QJS66_10870 [Kocuria rhizophila]